MPDIQVASDRSTVPSPCDDIKEAKVAKGEVLDIESDAYVMEGEDIGDEKLVSARRAEATEMTAAEAFKMNVDGDQSPCEWP